MRNYFLNIEKFYESYKEASYFDNIDSIRASYDREQLMFHGFFVHFVLLLVSFSTDRHHFCFKWWQNTLKLVPYSSFNPYFVLSIQSAFL
jgi:hypothetical protein